MSVDPRGRTKAYRRDREHVGVPETLRPSVRTIRADLIDDGDVRRRELGSGRARAGEHDLILALAPEAEFPRFEDMECEAMLEAGEYAFEAYEKQKRAAEALKAAESPADGRLPGCEAR